MADGSPEATKVMEKEVVCAVGDTGKGMRTAHEQKYGKKIKLVV